MLISNTDNLHMTLAELATLGLQDKILETFGLASVKNIKQYKKLCNVPFHREAAYWLLNRYSAVMADRVLRMYIRMFGDVESPKPMTAFQLLDITRSYLSIFPKDDMSANRIYYLIQKIKSGSSEGSMVLGVEPECQCCKKPFVVLGKHRSCISCVLLKSAKKDPAIFGFIQKHAQAKEGANYKIDGIKINEKITALRL